MLRSRRRAAPRMSLSNETRRADHTRRHTRARTTIARYFRPHQLKRRRRLLFCLIQIGIKARGCRPVGRFLMGVALNWSRAGPADVPTNKQTSRQSINCPANFIRPKAADRPGPIRPAPMDARSARWSTVAAAAATSTSLSDW